MITTQHWIQYFTDEDQDGNSIPYYYNIETTKTQWEMPEEIQYYHYARYDESLDNTSIPSPKTMNEFSKWLTSIGVHSISSLRSNSIRLLHTFHSNCIQSNPLQSLQKTSIQQEIDWNSLVCNQNGLLLYIICSQFYNPHSCFEELIACMEELLLFLPSNSITLPILLDSHFGGAEKCISCLTYFLYSCYDQKNEDIEVFCRFYMTISSYLPFSLPFLTQCQQYLQFKPSTSLMHCLILHSQNHIKEFIQTIEAPDSISSLLIQLLNEVDLNDSFVSILWQFVQLSLQIDTSILYKSDAMVLIDILIRNLHDYSSHHPIYSIFFSLLKQLYQTNRWKIDMHEYRKKEIEELLNKKM